MPQLNINKSKWEKEFSAGKWNYLDSNPAERARSAVIAIYCQYFYPKAKILDVGCGLGTILDFLNSIQRKKYLGIDISKVAITKARKKKANFKNIDFNAFKSKTKYDIIIFNEVLYYLDETNALKQALKLLNKNGLVIISLYRMKSKRYDQKIWQVSRKFFKSIGTTEITSLVKKQQVTWRVEVLKQK
ncbi:MAG: class I SAM-dependent methyltransferase [Patescibacteria group bacterium]